MALASEISAKLFTLPATFYTNVYGSPVTASSLSVSPNGWFYFSSVAHIDGYQFNPD